MKFYSVTKTLTWFRHKSRYQWFLKLCLTPTKKDIDLDEELDEDELDLDDEDLDEELDDESDEDKSEDEDEESKDEDEDDSKRTKTIRRNSCVSALCVNV